MFYSSLNYNEEEASLRETIFYGEEDFNFPLLFMDNYEQETESTLKKENIPKSEHNSSSINQNNKILGKKRKGEFKGVNNNLAYDNMFRTIRIYIINELIDFINNLIFKNYNGNIGQGRFIKKLLAIEQSKNKNIKENKEFIMKSLKDILSVNIKKKYSNYNNSHNKDLITNLLNEKDEEKKEIFENIFNLTFIDCLDHLCGKKDIKELEGIKPLDKIFQKEKDFFEYFKDLMFNLEETINRKHSRNRKKKKVNN